MKKERWTIDDLPWDSFDPKRLNSDHLMIVKAAAMVEYGADDYEQYLNHVFADDPIFQRAVSYWAAEERQHGETLGRYAQIADPSFKFGKAFARYKDGHKIDVAASQSSRGSRAGELVSRCVVEVGTSSYYTALGRATDEPLLKAICHNIAGDEFKHYAMFYSHLTGYVKHEKMSRLKRFRVAIERIKESGDDELAFAYHASNAPDGYPYKRQACADAYLTRAFTPYTRQDMDRIVAMILKACGFIGHYFWHGIVSSIAWRALQKQIKEADARLA